MESAVTSNGSLLRTMIVHSCVVREEVVNSHPHLVSFIDLYHRAWELPVDQNHVPAKTIWGMFLPSDGKMEKTRA